MLFGVIAGGFFHEFATFTDSALMFTLGVSFCLAGVAVLSSRSTPESKDEDNSDEVSMGVMTKIFRSPCLLAKQDLPQVIIRRLLMGVQSMGFDSSDYRTESNFLKWTPYFTKAPWGWDCFRK